MVAKDSAHSLPIARNQSLATSLIPRATSARCSRATLARALHNKAA